MFEIRLLGPKGSVINRQELPDQTSAEKEWRYVLAGFRRNGYSDEVTKVGFYRNGRCVEYDTLAAVERRIENRRKRNRR